jgi:hypothetical protein
MTHEGQPAAFVIHEVAAVRAVIHGLHYRNDFCNRLLIIGVRVRNDHAKGSLIML